VDSLFLHEKRADKVDHFRLVTTAEIMQTGPGMGISIKY